MRSRPGERRTSDGAPPPGDRGRRARGPRGFTVPAAFALVVLLVLPGLALLKLSGQVDMRFPLGIAGAASLITWVLYRSDKRSAQAGEWRTPEVTLHLAALLGGWPGAFLAQRMFRHKTSKLSFQFAYWSGVAVYQCVSLDYLMGWKFVNHAIAFLPR